MPLHIETMYGHPSSEAVACSVRPATSGNFSILDVRQRVPNIPELFGVESKMCLESKSRGSDASGQIRGIRLAGSVVAHR